MDWFSHMWLVGNGLVFVTSNVVCGKWTGFVASDVVCEKWTGFVTCGLWEMDWFCHMWFMGNGLVLSHVVCGKWTGFVTFGCGKWTGFVTSDVVLGRMISFVSFDEESRKDDLLCCI